MNRATILPVLATIVMLTLAACSPQDPPAAAGTSDTSEESDSAAPRAPTLAELEPIDLTHTYDEATVYWPTATTRFELDELSRGETEGGFFYSAYTLSTPEHGGTHLDAPFHFFREGWTADQIPVDRLIAPVIVIDVTEQATADRDYRLSAEDVHSWENRHGRIPAGSAVLLRTGWSRFWPDAKAYLGDDTPGDASNLHFPSYGVEAARLLIEDRSVGMLGVDTASIDHGPSADFPVHQVAGAHNVPGLENVASLDEVPVTGAWLIALPMKIGGGSGGPVRIVALVPPAGGAGRADG
ncbi:MAG TPA: cyclase family protein [Thermoanaerobaculia bacterium]|nr:cyclase family protein [Thermoanaerobaculia bacterium]